MRQYIGEALEAGLFGWQVTDCMVTMTECGYYASDGPTKPSGGTTRTVAADFRKLTPFVLRRALEQAKTVVCEPMIRARIEAPSDSLGAVLAAVARLGGAVEPSSQRGDLAMRRDRDAGGAPAGPAAPAARVSPPVKRQSRPASVATHPSAERRRSAGRRSRAPFRTTRLRLGGWSRSRAPHWAASARGSAPWDCTTHPGRRRRSARSCSVTCSNDSRSTRSCIGSSARTSPGSRPGRSIARLH